MIPGIQSMMVTEVLVTENAAAAGSTRPAVNVQKANWKMAQSTVRGFSHQKW